MTIELLAGYVYAFRVAAKKDGGYSDASNEVFFTAPEPSASGSVTLSTIRSKP